MYANALLKAIHAPNRRLYIISINADSMHMYDCKYFDFSISEIELRNYRKFDTLEVRFNPQVTVLTATNGGGKSAILQALAVGCTHFICSMGIKPGIPNGFLSDDHREIPQVGLGMARAEGDLEIHCKGKILDKEASWSRERSDRVNAKTRSGNATVQLSAAQELSALSARLDKGESSTYPVAPLIAFYDTLRLAREQRHTKQGKGATNRFKGYANCLALGSSIRFFKSWYSNLSAQILQEEENSQAHQILRWQRDTVNQAVSSALEHVQWSDLKWNFQKQDLSMRHPILGTLCYKQLSDGIQNILGMVADLAHRAVRLNPYPSRDLLKNIRGLVLIDEIDMYLHPQWQQRIVPALLKIFPRVQFVITTHSPQVLTTLRKDQIRCIYWDERNERYKAEEPGISPYAKSANIALAGVMDTQTQPDIEGVSDDIARLEWLYQDGETSDADKLRQQLEALGVEISNADVDFWKFIASRKKH